VSASVSLAEVTYTDGSMTCSSDPASIAVVREFADDIVATADRDGYVHPSVVRPTRVGGLAADYLACGEGSVRLLHVRGVKVPGRRRPDLVERCVWGPIPGIPLNRTFHRLALPSIDACVRGLIPEEAAARSNHVEVIHFGIIAGGGSLHSVARAIDISRIRIGGISFSYAASWNGRRPEWESFWLPFFACLRDRGLHTITRAGDHEDHVHLSLGFSPEDPRPPGITFSY